MPDLGSAPSNATGRAIRFDEVTEHEFAGFPYKGALPEPGIAILS